jgi:hypothetical protein
LSITVFCLVRLLHGLSCITTKNDPVSKAI